MSNITVPSDSRYFLGCRYSNKSDLDEAIKEDNFGSFLIKVNLRGMTRGQYIKDRQLWHLYKHGAANILTGLMKLPPNNGKEKSFPYVDLVKWALEEPHNKTFYAVLKTYLSLPVNEKAPLWTLVEQSDILVGYRRQTYYGSPRPFVNISTRASIRLYEFLRSLNPEAIKDFRGTWTDERDGRTYKTVTINGLTWLCENFKYGKESGVYELKDITEGNIVPEGWRLPMPEDWNVLRCSLRLDNPNNKIEGTDEYEDFDDGILPASEDLRAVMNKEAWSRCEFNGNSVMEGDLVGFNVKPTHVNKRFHGLDGALYWTGLEGSESRWRFNEDGINKDFAFKNIDLLLNDGYKKIPLEPTPGDLFSMGCIRLVKGKLGE
jgi:uncharacterized protein (TIGR02145 family)